MSDQPAPGLSVITPEEIAEKEADRLEKLAAFFDGHQPLGDSVHGDDPWGLIPGSDGEAAA